MNRLLDIEADMYVAAGDLTTFNRGLEKLAPVLARRADKMWILPGNHEHARDIEAFARATDSTRCMEVDPARRFTSPDWAIQPTPFHTPGEDSEETLPRI